MPSFHFDLGNSSVGQLGMCARITADSKEDAVERLKKLFDENAKDCEYVPVFESAEEYICVYINPDAITAADINDAETEDDDGNALE